MAGNVMALPLLRPCRRLAMRVSTDHQVLPAPTDASSAAGASGCTAKLSASRGDRPGRPACWTAPALVPPSAVSALNAPLTCGGRGASGGAHAAPSRSCAAATIRAAGIRRARKPDDGGQAV